MIEVMMFTITLLYMRKNTRKPALFVHHIPPRVEEVKGYFIQKGAPHQEAEAFYHVYENRHWISRSGNFIKNWKTVAYRWIASILQTRSTPPPAHQ